MDKRCWLAVLLFVMTSALGGTAHAYSLSRMPGSKVEAAFFDLQGGLWLPMTVTSVNHELSSIYAGELGVKVASLAQQHHLFLIGSFAYSPQRLRPQLRASTTAVLNGSLGLRYVPGSLCSYDGVGCPFFELSFGITSESAPPESGHQSISSAWTVGAGLGYRFWLAHAVQLGLRVDTAYLEENYDRRLSWLTPSVFAGVAF